MVSKKYFVSGILTAILGTVIVIAVLPDEEKKVKKQFRLLSEWVSKSPEENAFTKLQKMKNVVGLFDDRCELKTDYPSLSGTYTPEEISTYVGSAHSYVSRLDLRFYDLQIVFPEKGAAQVTLTARLVGRTTAGEQLDDTRELQCLLRKIEKKWLFSQIEVVEILKR